jgi:uncharacterized protein YndB with AHSA1/START domain
MSQILQLERVYGAAPEVVFDAFTDPEAQKELYADAPDWVVSSTIDLRAGGRWTIEFGPPDGPAALETSVFQVVDRPRRLRYTATMRMPDGTSFDTEVEVRFNEEAPGRTRLTILQTGFPTRQLRDEIAGGWPSILDGLGRVVVARSGASGTGGR